MTIAVRAMTEADLPRLVAWFREPHVFRWWRETPDLDAVRAKYLPRLAGIELVHMLIVTEREQSVGFAQWYEWNSSEDRGYYTIESDELGFDYTLGEPTAIGRGVGTALVTRLLDLLRERYALGTRVSVTPHADNAASRRILEKNGFAYVETVARGDAHYRRAL
ncbi:MAG TPA: GNAT family N-acetyltransferase [Kofleriaceae bacterium]|jgi:RimJ/RimL family protein N-acetyltransferase|nr:GNAT family N-acetyltransferase [Kofleriaceae bacterium]